MKIRLAKEQDLKQIMVIIHQAQQDLKEMNVNQWQNGYPNEEVLLNDIANKKAYVLTDEEVIGLMVVSVNDESTYLPLKTWQKEQYVVVHRFAVKKENQNQGAATFLISYAKQMAQQMNIDSLRIDTHEKNVRMRRFLEKNGFVQRGMISLKDGSPRVAYELLF